MKNKTLLSLAVACSTAVCAAEQTDVEFLYYDSSSRTEALASLGRIELLAGGTAYRIVSVEGEQIVSGPLSELVHVAFVESQTPNAIFSVEADRITSTNGTATAVYNLSGHKVSDGSLTGLSKGIYIVVSGSHAAKVIIK